MPSYLASQTHVDRALANFAASYSNNAFIADDVSPIALVDDKTGDFFARPIANTMLYVGQPTVGITDDVPETESDVKLQPFKCQGYGFLTSVPLELDQQADAPLNLRQDAVLDAAEKLKLSREVRVATVASTAANYKSGNAITVAGGDTWDQDTNDPIKQVETMRPLIMPGGNNKRIAWMGYAVWAMLKNNAKILSRVGGGSTTVLPAQVTKQKVAELFEVDALVVGEAWTISRAGVMARVWGKDFGIVSVPVFPSTRSLGFMQSFRWNKLGPSGFRNERWIDPRKGLFGIEKSKLVHADDDNIIAADAAILMKGAVA